MKAKRLADILEEAEEKRLKRAVTGLFNGVYSVRGLRQKESEIRAYVSKGDGRDYGVAINDSQAYCHCPDFFFTNEGICKHILMLSFTLLSETRDESLGFWAGTKGDGIWGAAGSGVEMKREGIWGSTGSGVSPTRSGIKRGGFWGTTSEEKEISGWER